MSLRFRTLKTPQGHVGFVASDRGLRRVYLPMRTADSLKYTIKKENPHATEDRRLLPKLSTALQRYFAGRPVRFDVKIDWADRSEFDVDVYHTCRRIPYGRTRSYKQLAERVGRPGAARAVGNAMRTNSCPIVVPCHRVLKSDGSLGGFNAPDGINTKRRLLQMEATATTR
jgi:methylated-DNA-[protein]-cysteine S-methyltransferase